MVGIDVRVYQSSTFEETSPRLSISPTFKDTEHSKERATTGTYALRITSALSPPAAPAPTRSGQSPSPMCRGGHVTAADEPPTTHGNTAPSERRLPVR